MISTAWNDTIAEIDRILVARLRALKDEGRELFGASTLEEAMRALMENNRIAISFGTATRHMYVIFDVELEKRSRFYAFQNWAETPEGGHYLWKVDQRSGWWSPIPRESDTGRFAMHRDAKAAFRNYCDHVFGGQIWFDALNQMGGCPVEFVDAVNAVTNQRLQAGFLVGVWGRGKGVFDSSPASHTTMAADASTLGEKPKWIFKCRV